MHSNSTFPLMEMKPRGFDSLEKTLSSPSQHPLFSTLITFYTLLMIYLPSSLFLKLLFSPVLFATAILLLTLLRLGATQRKFSPTQENSGNQNSAPPEKTSESSFSENYVVRDTILLKIQESGPACNFYEESFLEWDVRAPLEVIHEEYEEGEGDHHERNGDVPVSSIERYASLSFCYPETDSDGSSDGGDFAGIGGWDSQEGTCFMWDEEEKGEEDLIEIAFFDEKGGRGVVQVEEENLIEIDISPATVENVAGGI